MQYIVSLSDRAGLHLVLITLPKEAVTRPAIDVIFDLIGRENFDQIVAENIVAAGQLDDLRALQSMITARDAQGMYIKEGVDFKANGLPLEPDLSFEKAFVPAGLEGMKYYRCDLTVSTGASNNPRQDAQAALMQDFSRIIFLHEILVGQPLDVTRDVAVEYPDLKSSISWAEEQGLIEVDVNKATYKLTSKGMGLHDQYIAEAQDLIKRYDIYGDVDVDSAGKAHFDTGLGKDLRVPVFELEGIDPFRARILLGVNDGEWDDLPNWYELLQDSKWYDELFHPIEQAPTVDELGRAQLVSIMDQAKSALRGQT